MSWEASSMQSKRSFFNRTLFLKNLSRFWPLWGLVSLAGSLVPLYLLLSLLSNPWIQFYARDFANTLYVATIYFVPAFSFAYAALCAMLVWNYLYHPRSVGLMHTLPVDRTCLFVTTALSGLAMMIIPYVIVGALLSLIALCWGFLDIVAVVATSLAVLLMTVTFFGLATFCAMLTGNLFAMPVLYVLLNFLSPMLDILASALTSQFLVGLPAWNGFFNGRFNFLSPFYLYTQLSIESIPGADGYVESYILLGFVPLVLYGLAGLALLALAWLLYRRRPSECAGDVAAFQILRPVFRYGLALLSALSIGQLLYMMLWESLFQPGQYAQAIPMAVCMAAAGVLGWYAASMLLKKSLRVFRGSLPGVAVVCVGAVVLCIGLSMDFFGMERRVPDLKEVASVVVDSYQMDFSCNTDSEPELAQRLIDIHRAVVADLDYLRGDGPQYADQYRWWSITYRLKNGDTLTREYSLPFTKVRTADLGTYDGKMAALLDDPMVIMRRVAVPEGGTLTNVMIYDYESGYREDSLDAAGCQQLYDAILQDAREGGIPSQSLMDRDPPHYDFQMEIEYRTRSDYDGGYRYRYNWVYLYPTMDHTIAVLLEQGYLTQEALDEWDARWEAERLAEQADWNEKWGYDTEYGEIIVP